MADDWIAQEVSGILGRSNRRHQQREIRLLNAGIIRENGPTVWHAFVLAVKRDVGRFNEQIARDADLELEFAEDPASRFVVSRKKLLFPHVKVECTLNLIAERIECTHSRVVENFAPPIETREHFLLSVTDDGKFMVVHNGTIAVDADWMSQKTLTPLLGRL